MTKKSKRTFVLDTNILVYDPNAIFNFAEHDVVIPMTVTEELEHLKNGEETRNYSARQASRTLMSFIKQVKPNEEMWEIPPQSLGEGKGNLIFMAFTGYPKMLGKKKLSGNLFLKDTADNRIISIAYELKRRGLNVTLVSKENNVHINAKTLGINCEDYINGMVKDPSQLTEKIKEIDADDLCDPPACSIKLELYLNQPVLVKEHGEGGQQHIYRWLGENFQHIKRERIGKTSIKSKNLEQDFAVNILMDPTLTSIALIGSAGSGKTLLAIACALAQKDRYDSILVARPAIELSNKTMGFLPGTLEEKYDPYLAPVRSSCRFIMDGTDGGEKKKESDVSKWMDEHGIELLPLSVIRGDTFHKAFILVDEAQNLNPIEVKTIVSRAGEGTKIVFTGDINQIDVQYLSKESNGLSHLIHCFRGQPYFAFIEMQKSVRSALAEAADKLL